MTSHINRLFLISVIITVVTYISHAIADEHDQPALISESYQTLSLVRELMEEEKYSQAEDKLKQLLDSRPNRYDEAVIWQTLGHIYSAIHDYQKATESLINSIQNNILPDNVIHETRYNIAKLLVMNSQYKESLDYLLPWLDKEPKPGHEAFILAASTYYALEDYESMIPYVQKAIQLSSIPDKSLYELLLSGYYQSGNFRQAVSVLERLIDLFPNTDSYWLQLASTYQLSKQYKKALAMYELALNKGLLDEPGILRLVYLYLQEELPYKAAVLLQKKLNSGFLQKTPENLELQANSWLLAREMDNAIAALSQLIDIKNDPEIYYRIGKIQFEQENWNEVIVNMEKATRVENPDLKAEAYLLMGISAYNINRITQSSRALNEAFSSEVTRDQAKWWLKKLEEKLKQENNNTS